MKLLALGIWGFRGIEYAQIVFSGSQVFVGPNGSGKSTIIDALSLVLGRQRIMRSLTEHDFIGSSPSRQDRIRIVATLGGFPTNNPEDYPQWFRMGRAVVKWWLPKMRCVKPQPEGADSELCAQIGFAARFDHDELSVEHKRYFHDDDDIVDPFLDDGVAVFPSKLLDEVGLFVLPVHRTWASAISFESDLFRRAVATLAGIPAESLLKYRDDLRNPGSKLEDDPALRPLVDRINLTMAQLLPCNPRLQLRITSTDSDSLLQALIPHYQLDDGTALPAGRHGTGLVSLQTLVLLLEIGRARHEKGQSFVLALEEPEIHVPPGLQRRLIGEVTAVADQVICTTHSPRVASFFEPQKIWVLTKPLGAEARRQSAPQRLEVRQLASSSLIDEPNAVIQLYTDDRTRLLEALMFPWALVPEGKTDAEWLRLLLDVAETCTQSDPPSQNPVPPFGSIVGVIPTRHSAVRVTFEKIRSLHHNVFVLVDGDSEGDRYIADLLRCEPPPCAVVQWPRGWTMENAIEWVIAADEAGLLEQINKRLNLGLGKLTDLIDRLRNDDGRTGGLKQHYMAHEEIAAAMKGSPASAKRAEILLEALTRVALSKYDGFAHLEIDAGRSAPRATVLRFRT